MSKKQSIEQEVEELYDEKMEYQGKGEVVLQKKKEKKQKGAFDDLYEERYFRNKNREKEVVRVTMTTVVDAIPGKSERVKLPDENAHHAQLDKLDDEKADLWDHFKKYAREIRKQAYQGGKEQSDTGSLLKVLKEKQAERKKLRDQMKEIKTNFDSKKKELEDIWEKQSKLRLKMKRLMKKEELESILGELQFKQANLKMSLSEEKQIIKEIQDLKDSLPFAAPLEDLEKQRVPLKKEKDVLAGKMKVLWEQIQVISKEIDEMSTDYDQIKKTQNEQFDNMDPAITNKKAETEKKVEQIRATKKRLIKEYKDKLNAYDDQQAMIKKLEWMNNAK